jgi:HAMP domain-containing protein
VRFSLPVESANEALAHFRRVVLLWSLLILAVAGAVSMLVSRRFTGRIERLREFSRRVAEGDFRPLPADGTGDTLEALGHSLNQTASRLVAPSIRSPKNAIYRRDSGFDGGGCRGGKWRRAPGFHQSGLCGNFGTGRPSGLGSALLEVVVRPS